ncbi:LOW QUALITY PROTEIN: NACHT, LRR and PYD domains-containing protein 6 [Erethizon dorsatum]
MDQASVSHSSLEPRAAGRKLLLAALEYLSQDQLKRFRHKLRDVLVDGRSIPWERLERANAVDLADQLTHFYGPEPAVDVARRTLKRANVRDVAARLKAQGLQRLGEGEFPALRPYLRISTPQFQKKYHEHVLQQHAKVNKRNVRSVKISQRFTKPLIAPESAAPREEEAERGPLEEPEGRRAWRSDTHTFNPLFGSDPEDRRPLTVVLQGPAGIGQTKAAKKILYDWVAGKVDFAYFLQCPELLERTDARNLSDLILDQCPGRCAPVLQMLAQPQRLFFILDGAELPGPGAFEVAHCRDPLEAASGARVLGGLLSKALLPLVRLPVTRAPPSPGSCTACSLAPQCAKVRGISDKDKKCFYKFLKELRAKRAYRFVKDNETLFALCFTPVVCWIVCTVLLRQLELGRNLSPTSKTTTSVYLLFLGNTPSSMGAKGPCMVGGGLRKLCHLARDRVLGLKVFSERDLERLELRGSNVQHFLIKKELLAVLETEVIYQFINPSFQEFFAALSYLLEDEGMPKVPVGALGTLLHKGIEGRSHLTLSTHFFFGLLSVEHVQDVQCYFSCMVLAHVKQDALQWVQGQGHPRVVPEGTDGTEGLNDTEKPEEEEEEEEEEPNLPLELLYCLYETRDDTFVCQALSSPELMLERACFSCMDLNVLSYCIRCCPAGQVLWLVSCSLVAGQEKKKRSLAEQLKGSQAAMKQLQVSPLQPLCEAMTDLQCGLSSLMMSHCKLSNWVCDLSMALRGAPTLTELGLLHCRLSDADLRVLSESPAWPQYPVWTLRVLLPSPLEVFQYLIVLLRQSPTLTTLDLSNYHLPGPMVTYLCAVLQHPGCSLQTLNLPSVELNEPLVQELRAMKTAKSSLAIIHPALDSHPGPPEGVISVL